MQFKENSNRSRRGKKPGTVTPNAGRKRKPDPMITLTMTVPESRVKLFGGKAKCQLKMYEAVLTPDQLLEKVNNLAKYGKMEDAA